MNTHVWIRRTTRHAKCFHCGKNIPKHDYMVVTQLYKDRAPSPEGKHRAWWTIRRFHPQCWIDQGIAAIKAIPVVESRGRKRVPMRDDTRTARLKIMQRRASIMQRLKKATIETPYDIDKIIHLGQMIDELKAEIIEQGGLPKSWE